MLHAKLCVIFLVSQSVVKVALHQPNFVIVLGDDVGYGDLQCYGHPSQERGAIDVMAKEGMKFMNWYSAESSDTSSRAALLTGRLSVRTGMYGPGRSLTKVDSGGLPDAEITVAEALKQLGYTTGMAGKWHLGINENAAADGNHLPAHHGFQHVLFNHPSSQMWECDPNKFSIEGMKENCFKYRNKTIVQQPVSYENSTADLVNDANSFIRQHSQGPFFFYLSLLQTHCSLFCSDKFCGKSARGRYGDSINEMSWAVGEVIETLKELQIDEKTLVMFLSDNGPQLEMCTDGGVTGYLFGGKASSWDGGLRVPAIVRWPGTIPEGAINHEIVSTLDVYPTLLELAQPDNLATDEETRIYDGKSLVTVMQNGASSPHKFLFHYCSDRLMAVRYGSLKFHFVTQDLSMDKTKRCTEGKPNDCAILNGECYADSVTAHEPPLIFNTDHDPSELHALNAEKYSVELGIVYAGVDDHNAMMIKEEPQIGRQNQKLQPCCNPPDCTCNYNGASFNVAKLDFTVILCFAFLQSACALQ